MGYRDGLHNIAVGGCLIASILVVSPSLGQQNNPVSESASDQAAIDRPQADEMSAVPFAKGKKIDFGTYRALCDQPEDKDHADLCQQWRMAEAAEEQVEWVRRQFYATIGEIAALVITIVFTAFAAVAASRAARAADASVGVASKTAEAQLRAYVAIVGGEIGSAIVDHGPGIAVHIELKNSGVTPAYKFSTWIMVDVRDKDAPVPFTDPLPLEKRTGSSVCGPGASAHLNFFRALAHDDQAALDAGTKSIFVWGGADYEDAFGRQRHFIFRCVNGPPMRAGLWGLNPHKMGYDAN